MNKVSSFSSKLINQQQKSTSSIKQIIIKNISLHKACSAPSVRKSRDTQQEGCRPRCACQSRKRLRQQLLHCCQHKAACLNRLFVVAFRLFGEESRTFFVGRKAFSYNKYVFHCMFRTNKKLQIMVVTCSS